MMINYIFSVIVIALSLLYVVNINRILFLIDGTCSPYKKVIPLLVCLSAASSVCGFFSFSDNVPVTVSLFTLLFYVLVFLIVYLMHPNKRSALYVTAVYMCLDSILQSMCKLLLDFFWTSSMVSGISKLASLLINLLILLLTTRYMEKNDNILPFTAKLIPTKVHGLVLSMLMLLGELFGCYQSKFSNETLQNNILMISTLIIIPIIFMMIIYLIKSCISKQYYELMSDIMEKNVNEQISYYKKIDTMNNDMKRFRHDYKNHLQCISMLIDSKQYSKASQYIQDVTKQEIISSKTYSTGNYIADSILDNKNENAQANNAEIVFSGAIDSNAPLSKLSTILFNALDNAVEACGRINSSEKMVIDVRCAVSHNIQVISISNPMPEKSRFDKTSKSDKKNHGFGLINIRKAVNDLDGQMKIDTENGIFSLTVEYSLSGCSMV